MTSNYRLKLDLRANGGFCFLETPDRLLPLFFASMIFIPGTGSKLAWIVQKSWDKTNFALDRS